MQKTANTREGRNLIETRGLREDVIKEVEFEFVLISCRVWRLEKTEPLQTGNKT